MPSQRRTLGPDTSYRSTACQIGTHHACAESTPESAPVDLPLIYEACDCLCHSAPGQSEPTGTPAPNIEATEGRVQG